MPAGKLPPKPADQPAPGINDSDDMTQNNIAALDVSSVVLDARIQAQLGRQLSAYYTGLVKQPVPDTFLELLKKLERAEKGE